MTITNMMKRNLTLLLAAAALAVLASCSENDVVKDNGNQTPTDSAQTRAVTFGISLPDNSTRASKNATTNPFQTGDKMAVYAFQDSENLLFDNQLVANVGKRIWEYTPVKYWQSGSSYKFYAIYPYDAAETAYTFDTFVPSIAPYFTVNDFTVNDDTDSQVDVMIAQELDATPFNTVDFVFNHLLSNVNFYFKTSADFDFTGIESFEVLSFDVANLKSTATYTQTAWDATTHMAVGAWDDHSGDYDFPEVASTTTAPVLVADNATTGELSTDLLLMPQTLADDVNMKVVYRINYTDGSTSTFRPDAVTLNLVKGYWMSDASQTLNTITAWEPNNVYNYTLVLNPAKKIVLWDSADHNGTTGEDEAKVSSVVVDGEDAEGNDLYWVDTDGDKKGDLPIVWEDIDDDGFLEGGVDADGDGHIDDVDADGTTITAGTASDNKHIGPTDDRDVAGHEGKDATLIFKDTADDTDAEHPKTQLELPGDDNGEEILPDPNDPPFDPADPNADTTNKIDWDGTLSDGDGVPTATLVADPAMEGEYMVDVDNDGVGDYRVVWEDIDGDGVLEGGVDRDGDGQIDDVDGDSGVISAGTHSDRLDQGPSDDVDANTDFKDVILIDTDGDGVAETQLERIPDEPTSAAIQFTATVQKWQNEYDASVEINNNGSK